MGTLTLFQENLFPENIRSGEDCCLWISIASKNSIGGIDKECLKYELAVVLIRLWTQINIQ
ncbi:putative two-glycosyltransferase domain protein [Rickettsia amblyommatis str. Darkwater]|nr:putative two-glycosyltransferase domain protein [Rickettsia amblyommatis str. Darkwater]